jgi:hypothetical protein
MPLNLIFITSGDYTLTDDGIPGNDTSVIKDGTGAVIFTFLHPVDAFGLTSTAAGVLLSLDFFESFGAANVTIGDTSLTNFERISIQNLVTTGNVALMSAGAIREMKVDLGADVTAGMLAMTAGTGIGTNSAIETRTEFLEAETTTGKIEIVNFGNVTIGGVSADIGGISGGTEGDVRITAYGSIALNDTDGTAMVIGSATGDVELTAIGAFSDVVCAADKDAINATGGDISITAGRNAAFGTAGSNFDNDVRAKGDIKIDTGGYFWIDGFSDLASDDFGANTGGSVDITAGQGIYVIDTFGTDATVQAGGAAGGSVTLTAHNSGVHISAPSANAVVSFSGDVTVVADTVILASDSGITAGVGQITLRPFTAGAPVNLGTGADLPLTLCLSDAELDRMFTPKIVVGGPEAGPVSIVAGISPLNSTDLVLQSETDVAIANGVFVTVSGALTVRAGRDFTAGSGAGVAAPGGITVFVDHGNTDPGEGGWAYVDPAFSTAVTFNGEADSDTLMAGAGADFLNGFGGDDILEGRGGADTLDGGAGDDAMAGGLGDDTFFVNSEGDTATELAAEGTDTVNASASHTLSANVEDLILTGNDGIDGTGNAEANEITGNKANNVLDGAGGDDTINGKKGSDIIVGGLGADTLEGKEGADKFRYFAVTDSLSGTEDTIVDFGAGNDDIDVAAIDAKESNGGNQAFVFIGDASFSAEGQIRATQSGDDTRVSFNTSGNGGAEMVVILADFTAASLTESHFVL